MGQSKADGCCGCDALGAIVTSIVISTIITVVYVRSVEYMVTGQLNAYDARLKEMRKVAEGEEGLYTRARNLVRILETLDVAIDIKGAKFVACMQDKPYTPQEEVVFHKVLGHLKGHDEDDAVVRAFHAEVPTECDPTTNRCWAKPPAAKDPHDVTCYGPQCVSNTAKADCDATSIGLDGKVHCPGVITEAIHIPSQEVKQEPKGGE